MAFNTGISTAIQQYVYTQSNGAVTEPVNASYIQAYCEYLGATTLIGNSWLITLCNHFGITEPLNGSWTIALAAHYNITTPAPYATWWLALANAGGTPPTPPFIWDQDTNNWEAEDRLWAEIVPVAPTANFTSDTQTVDVGGTVNFTDTSTDNATSWLWSFTGGTPSTSVAQNPAVVYNTPGQYEVSLEATNAYGSNTKTVPNYITVNAPVGATYWLTTALDTILGDIKAGQTVYTTEALNTKLN